MELTQWDKRHEELMLPVTRIRTKKALGSGTVIYSKPGKDNDYTTLILTNWHVVENLIEVKEVWSSLLQRNIKKDVRSIADVDFFEYRWVSRAIGQTAIQADIAAYDRDEDLALLKLRSGKPVPAVAKLYPKDKENKLRVTMPVFTVGAGLGESPIITQGMLSQFGIDIDNREFILNSAASIFGNSGGAMFLADTHELLGVPARIAVTWGSAVTHMSYAIPITRIYAFLENQRYRFIYDSQFTEEGEDKERERMRERDERRRLGEGAEGETEKDKKGLGTE